MMECDYRYVLEKTDDMLAGFKYGRSLEEISGRFRQSGVKAKVEGKYYCISKKAAHYFNEYKDSITSVAVRVAHASGIPFSEVENSLLKKEKLLGDICFESFFSSALSMCMGYAAMCVPDAFNNMYFTINNRKLVPGEMLCTGTDEVYNGKYGTKYVLHNRGTISVQKIQRIQNEIRIKNIYEGGIKEKGYVSIVNDITSDADKKVINRARRTAICVSGLKGKIDAENAAFETKERRTSTWKQQGR